MMARTQRFAVAVTSLLLACIGRSGQQVSTDGQPCAAPVYFGICDPYVPGTIIRMSDDRKAIDVVDTWHDGPAEKSGVCPGDKIVAVNGVPVAGHTYGQMLKQLVSPAPSPIGLKVVRGQQELDFHFERARESTLAQLRHQEYVLRRLLMDGLQPGIVPADETPAELKELDRFFDGVDRRVGFQFVDGLDVPEGAPEEQIRVLVATAFRGPEHDRWVGMTGMALGENANIPGFDAVLLKNPEEVLVDHVLPGSPAHRAGLFPGDQILEVAGHPVSGLNASQISHLILQPDELGEVVIKVRRGRSTLSIRIATQKVKEIDKATPYQRFRSDLGTEILLAENPREAIVTQVDYPLPAFFAGLLIGDRILAVNGVPIAQISRQQLTEMLQPQGDSLLRLEVSRLGKELHFEIKRMTLSEVEAKIGRKVTKRGLVPEHCP